VVLTMLASGDVTNNRKVLINRINKSFIKYLLFDIETKNTQMFL